MTLQLALPGDPRAVLIPADADKDTRYRVGRFLAWLLLMAGDPWSPDLASYRDALIRAGLAPATIGAHLATIRGRYRRVLEDTATRRALLAAAGAYLRSVGRDDGPADCAALVTERLRGLEDAINPRNAPVRIPSVLDRPDSDFIRLTVHEAGALLRAPGLATPRGLRDTALIALGLCCGLREAELCGLDVRDLWETWGGEAGLLVRRGKGDVQRFVPYGRLRWARLLADAWLHRAGIQTGPVFRGLYRGGRVRTGRLTVRAVQDILGAYPVEVSGELRTVKPHDLRRSYAALLHGAGMDLAVIQQNLGHRSVETTLGYIGPLDAAKRAPPEILSFDLAALRAAMA